MTLRERIRIRRMLTKREFRKNLNMHLISEAGNLVTERLRNRRLGGSLHEIRPLRFTNPHQLSSSPKIIPIIDLLIP